MFLKLKKKINKTLILNIYKTMELILILIKNWRYNTVIHLKYNIKQRLIEKAAMSIKTTR